MSAHITATVRASFAALRQIRSVRRSLTELQTEQLITSRIRSHTVFNKLLNCRPQILQLPYPCFMHLLLIFSRLLLWYQLLYKPWTTPWEMAIFDPHSSETPQPIVMKLEIYNNLRDRPRMQNFRGPCRRWWSGHMASFTHESFLLFLRHVHWSHLWSHRRAQYVIIRRSCLLGLEKWNLRHMSKEKGPDRKRNVSAATSRQCHISLISARWLNSTVVYNVYTLQTKPLLIGWRHTARTSRSIWWLICVLMFLWFCTSFCLFCLRFMGLTVWDNKCMYMYVCMYVTAILYLSRR